MAMRFITTESRFSLGNQVGSMNADEYFAMESEDFLFIKRKEEISITQGSRSVVMPIEEWSLLARDMEYFISMSRFKANGEVKKRTRGFGSNGRKKAEKLKNK